MSALYYTCGNCQSRHRVERLHPITVARSWFCPGCGQPAKASQDYQEDYWYVLARSYGLPETQKGVRLIKEIYATWDSSEFQRFGDYMTALSKGNI